MGHLLPGSVAPRTYDDVVALALNDEYVRAMRVSELVDAVRVARGTHEFPREWIALLADTEPEAASWGNREWTG